MICCVEFVVCVETSSDKVGVENIPESGQPIMLHVLRFLAASLFCDLAPPYCIQVVSAAAAWAGIGFSPDGMMVGSDAVVGLPDEASVLEYDLLGQVSTSLVVPQLGCRSPVLFTAPKIS